MVAATLALVLLTVPRCLVLEEEANCDYGSGWRCRNVVLEHCTNDGGDPPYRWKFVETCGPGLCRASSGSQGTGSCEVVAPVVPRDPRCPGAGEPDAAVCAGNVVLRCRDGHPVTSIDCGHVSPTGAYATGAPGDEGTVCSLVDGKAGCRTPP